MNTNLCRKSLLRGIPNLYLNVWDMHTKAFNYLKADDAVLSRNKTKAEAFIVLMFFTSAFMAILVTQ